MLNIYDLLGSALQKLSNDVSATNGSSGVPSVVGGPRRRDDDSISDKTSPTSSGGSVIASLGKSIEMHGQSLVDVAKMDAKEKGMERIHKLKGEKRSLMIKHAEETEKGRKAVVDTIMDQITDIAKEIEYITEQLESTQETPKKRNRTTPDEESGDHDN